MQIQINSDHQINPSPELASRIRTLIQDTLDRHSDRITRVEVHLNDQNSVKGGSNDKRCLMEARVAGLGPDRRRPRSGKSAARDRRRDGEARARDRAQARQGSR